MAFHGKLQSGGTESIITWSDEALLHIIKGKITCSWYTNHLQLLELCYSITDVIDSIRGILASILNMDLCGTDIIRLWSTVSVFYVKDEVDSCPAKRQFDFWLSPIFGGCPLTFILTEDEDRSTEYIGVSPPCFSCYLSLYLEKYLQYSIDITTEQSFRYMEFIDAKIWISKNASLCRVFANRVTFENTAQQLWLQRLTRPTKQQNTNI